MVTQLIHSVTTSMTIFCPPPHFFWRVGVGVCRFPLFSCMWAKVCVTCYSKNNRGKVISLKNYEILVSMWTFALHFNVIFFWKIVNFINFYLAGNLWIHDSAITLTDSFIFRALSSCGHVQWDAKTRRGTTGAHVQQGRFRHGNKERRRLVGREAGSRKWLVPRSVG